MIAKKLLLSICALLTVYGLSACQNLSAGHKTSLGGGNDATSSQEASRKDTDDVDDNASSGGKSSDESSQKKFPAFEGTDFDGNPVSSEELFSQNTVTVVNFWFTTCGPCVSELKQLSDLNEQLKEFNGALVGINVFTLDGVQEEISAAKDVMSQTAATHQNIYFDHDSKAGRFSDTLQAFPTTFVVDKEGNIVGEPIVGSIISAAQEQELIDTINSVIAKE